MAVSVAQAKIGDIVKANVKGRVFHAEVTGQAYREKGRGLVIDVKPLTRAVSYYNIRGRDVEELYRKLGRPRG